MDRSLKCWNLSSGECVGTITSMNDGHTEPVTCLEALNVAGQDYVVSGGADCMLKIWDSAGKSLLSDHQGAVITALKATQDSFGACILGGCM